MAADDKGLLNKDRRVQLEQAAEFISVLARLHDREADAELLNGLREEKVLVWMAELVETELASKAVRALEASLADLPTPIDEETIDTLAAEYTDIYLTHNYSIGTTGSVWLTDEHLERQQPMFDVRELYDHYGIKVENWRIRPDDHLVCELQFVQHLCQLGTVNAALDMVYFLDKHLLSWLPDFAELVARRPTASFYIASALLTNGFMQELRDLLEDITGIERPVEEPEASNEDLTTLYDAEIDRPYMPGISESW